MAESKIITQQQNPFLHREELKIEIQSRSSPTYSEVKQAVGKQEDLTIVKRINCNFGKRTFTADVYVYDTKENMRKIERIKEEEKKEEAPSAPVVQVVDAKPAEKPVEEKKEEAKE